MVSDDLYGVQVLPLGLGQIPNLLLLLHDELGTDGLLQLQDEAGLGQGHDVRGVIDLEEKEREGFFHSLSNANVYAYINSEKLKTKRKS